MKGWGRVLESDGRMENFRRAEEGREGGRRIINDRAIIFIAGKATRQG